MPGINKRTLSAGAFLFTVFFQCILFCDEVTALDVNANIAADTVWTVADSPVVINKADFTVPVAVTLTIQPGVTVQVKSYINVYGVLSAVGTSADRISFAKHDNDSNWAGIHFEYTVGVLNQNEIKYADLTDTGGSNGSINSDRQSVVIDHCTVTVNGGYKTAVYGYGGIVKPAGLAMSLTNSIVTFTSTYGGSSGEVEAVHLDGFDATISDNTINLSSNAENLYVKAVGLTCSNTEAFTADIVNNNITVTGTHNSITNIYGIYFDEWEASGEVKGNTMNLTGPRSVIGVSTYSAKEISGNNITGTITSNYATATGYGIYSLCGSAGSDDYVFNNSVQLTTDQANIRLYGIHAQSGKIRNNVLKTSHTGSSGQAYGIYTSYYDVYIENNSILMTTAAGVSEYGICFGTHYNASKTSYLRNNIFQGDAVATSKGINKSNGYAASVVNSYNSVYNFTDTYDGLTAGTGSLTSDPDFADDSLHLNQGSPAIDAGDPASAYSNEPAPNGGRINMGAYGNTASATVSPSVPTVTTTAASSVTISGAASGGNVTSDGGASVTGRGVCWSTSSNPTTSNSRTSDGTGTGSFTSSITGLSSGTTYYVRAYATNSAGTAYGSQVSFTTDTTPTITTTAASSVTISGAASGGNVTSDGGDSVTTKGVCWSTTADPTTDDGHTTDGSGSGTFVSAITGLSAATTYHIRAYATNSAGTGYGSDVSFKTSYSSTRYVNKDGSCGGEPMCHTTIQDAINEASTGEAIMISGEIYDEDITLDADKSLTLIGSSTGSTILYNAPRAPRGSLALQKMIIQPQ